MWELICLDEGGPQLADLWVRIITPEVEIPKVCSKGERWARRPLLIDSGSNTGLMISSRAHWPWGHIPDILPSNSDVLVSLQRADVPFTACVAVGGGGWGSETN